MEKPRPKYRRWLIRIGIVVGVVLVLALVVRVLMRSEWVLDYVSEKLVAAVEDVTGAEVRLGALRGDLAGSLVATDFSLAKEDTLLQVDSLRIRYTIGSLLYRTIDLSLVRLSGLRVHVKQDASGVWSYQNYLPQSDTLATDPSSQRDTTAEEEGFLDRWRIRIQRLQVADAQAVVDAPALLPEGPALVRDLSLDGSYTQYGETFDVTVRDLSFHADGIGLPDELALKMQAEADDSQVNLADLLISVGRTRLSGRGVYSTADSTADASIHAAPLAAGTVNALVDSLEVYDDLDIDLRVNGRLSNPSATMVVARTGGGLLLEASASATKNDTGYAITAFDTSTGGMDLATLIAIPDMEMPRIGATEVQFAGNIPVSEPQKGTGSLRVDAEDAAYATYRLGRLHLEGDMDAAGGSLRGQMQTGANRADVELAVQDPFGERPSWDLNATARVERLSQVDLSQDMQLVLRADIRANGTGFDPYTARARYSARIRDAVVDSQAVEMAFVQGRLNGDLTLDSALVVLGGGSRVWAEGRTTLDFEEPEYELRAATDAFNVADVKGMEALETRIKARFSLTGVCFSEELRQMEAHLRVDSSWVNNTLVDSLRANLVLDRNTLTLSETSLNSDIADGQFSGRLRIDSLYFPDNRLEFQLQLKNLQPLAEVAGAQRLGAVGEIRGRIEDTGEGAQLVAIVGVDDIVYDSTEVRRVVGQYTMELREQPAYLAELDLLGPFVAGRRLQDIRLTSRGRFQPDGAIGSYGVEVNLQENSGLLLQGGFTKVADSLFFDSSAFDIRGPLRTYSQVRPFSVAIRDGVITSDTLRLEAPPDASLELQLRHIDQDSVALAVAIHQVNAQALQESVMEEAMVRGNISGFIDLAYTETLFIVDADVAVADFGFGEAELDSIKLVGNIDEGQLNGSLLVRDQGYDLMTASLDVPFRLGDPTGFDEAFFEQPVSGRLIVPETDLRRYEDLFRQMNMPPIEGIVSVNSTLRGIAGIPVFDGTFTFANGRVANIPVDRFEIGWLYDQAQRRVDITTTLDATGQRALNGEASVPLNLDLRNFEAILPQDSDPVSGSLVADNFNLALLNPFIPIEVADDLKGSVAGRVDIAGTFGEPDIQGRLDLTRGSVFASSANMEFRDITMGLRLQPDRIEVERMSARGGSGNMQASGYVTLDGFTPDRIDVHIEGKDFRVMNTRDIEAALTMNATMGGTYLLPELTGSVSVSNGNIFLDNFGERTVEDVRLDSAETFESPSFYDSLTIRMRVQLEPNVWLRNRSSPEMALELEGDMDLLKEKNGEIQAFGSLSTRQGYAMQYGKRFQVERGDLTFSGDIANPQMDIVAVYELRAPEDIEISYLIGGTLEEPTFDFSSDPEMELENIISYTLFGKPFGALFSWQQSFSGGGGGNDLARDAAIGVLVDRVEALATEALGIDLLQIDTNRQGESTTTSVKAGKYITDKLFVAVLNELGGSDAITRVVLEYYVRRNLQFILTQGNDRRSGFDIRWKYEY